MNDEKLDQIKSMMFKIVNESLEDKVPVEKEFFVAIEKAKKGIEALIAAGIYPTITDDEYKDIKKYLQKEVSVQMEGFDAVIVDKNAHHKPWLMSSETRIDWFFWNRYVKYLEHDQHWNPQVIASLNKSSTQIVDLLGNPQCDQSFARRGLVLGDVQSGKTATYTAIAAKAADAGYDIIIVLAGMLEDLRCQTQDRLDKELAGRKSAAFLDFTKKGAQKNIPLGVNKYGRGKNIAQFTSTLKDFDSNILKSNSLDLRDIKTTVLLVVKKNKLILENLIGWLKPDNDNKINQSLLIIDDEADNASINTIDKDKDKKKELATAINKCIRTILVMFNQSSYLGITATPFANIFIDPDTDDEMLGDDLFPRDFIYALDVPNNYIGADAVFGEDGKYGSSMLMEVDTDDVDRFFPYKHKSEDCLTGLPKSLYDALNYFLLINAIRDSRGDARKHRTMLIHVSRLTAMHKKIRGLVDEWLFKVQCDLRNFANKKIEDADKVSSIQELHKIFELTNLENISGLSWGTLLHKYLRKAVDPIVVQVRNSDKENKDALDYLGASDGLRVIAIGGNSFSRGLTLEGLCVTYFYRHSQMYDTLMQMGRWFGYRPNYDDLCRIWTSKDIIYSYRYINKAINELKNEIRFMQRRNQAPKNFGLKVRQDPHALIITARNKMRTGQNFVQPVSLSRQFLDAPRLKKEKLDDNKKVMMKFISSLNNIGRREEQRKCQYFWRGVSKQYIADLLMSFETDPWQLAFQGRALSDYILNEMGNKPWDVAIPNGTGEEFKEIFMNKEYFPVRMMEHTIDVKDTQVLIGGTKVRVGSGGLAQIGLDQDAFERIKEENKNNKKALSDKEYLIEDRNPILFVYIVQIKEPEKYPDLPKVIFSLGLGFPDTGNMKSTAKYIINKVGYNEYYGYTEDEEVEE